jgi:large subunit ribosomal protein L25
LKPEDLTRALTTDYRRNQLIELHIQPADGGEAVTHHALVRDLEVHPVTRKILHADFYRVEADQKVRTKVPFEIRGRSIGVQKGGKIRKLFRALPVEAVPSKVPAKIVLDVAPLDINATVNVEDLPLDEGVKVTYPPERRVLFVEFKERDVEKKADDGEAES